MQLLQQFFIIIILLYYITSIYCAYRTVSDSPIQIISIKSPTDAQILLPIRNGRKKNKIKRKKNAEKLGGGGGGGGGTSNIITLIKKQPYRTLHMLGNQHGARLHIAPGAYPVYYSIAKTNGKFNGKTIRSLSRNEI